MIQHRKTTAYLTREAALQAPAKPAFRRPQLGGCTDGKHWPEPGTVIDNGDVQTAKCRRCGFDIKRMANSKVWMFTGVLG